VDYATSIANFLIGISLVWQGYQPYPNKDSALLLTMLSIMEARRTGP